MKPNRRLQLLVWVMALGVFTGLAFLSGQWGGTHSAPTRTVAAAPAATSGDRTLAAGALPSGIPDDPTGAQPDFCKSKDAADQYLPIHRWTSFNLFVVDNAMIIKTRLFMTFIASLMFMAASLIWQLIDVFMGFGYSYDTICAVADPINVATGDIAQYASFFLIPVWLFVLATAFKRWSAAGKNGAGSAIRLVVGFTIASGMIFFVADQSSSHGNGHALDRYTVPWMAVTVEGWFGEMGTSLVALGDLATGNKGASSPGAFYDTDPSRAGKVTCSAFDNSLYTFYKNDSTSAGVPVANTSAMIQVSKIWEMSFLRNWVSAQFGDGNKTYPSPSLAACRMAEAHSGLSMNEVSDTYDRAVGAKVGTSRNSRRAQYLVPQDGEQTAMVAWGACQANDDGMGSNGGIAQWASIKGNAWWPWQHAADVPKGCKELYNSDRVTSNTLTDVTNGKGDVGNFYFNGSDQLNDKLGACMHTADCQHDWDFVSGWLGANSAERLTQGLMALIVGVVFLFVLGPMAIGLTAISDALAILAMLFPVTLIMLAMGLDQGKRLLKLTGATAAGKFLFTLALTAMLLFINITDDAIRAVFNSDQPGFLEQILQAGAPIIALLIFRKLSKVMGVGNITSFSGAMGFAGAAVLKATGDRKYSRNADRRMSGAMAAIGLDNPVLGALDERSLQRRIVSNRGGKSLLASAKAKLSRSPQPLDDVAKDKQERERAQLLTTANELERRAASGTPADRAAAYAGLTAALAALAVAVPVAVVATGSMADRRNQARKGRDPDADGVGLGYQPGTAAGVPMAKDPKAALRQADDWHRNISRVSDPQERRALTAAHTRDGLAMVRAQQWGKDGLNLDFQGFATNDEKIRARAELAAQHGVREDQIMLGDNGLWLPVPAPVDRRTGQPVFPEDASFEYKTHPVHNLDRETLRPLVIDGVEETEEQRAVRWVAQLRERGHVTDDGEFVTAFDARGFDTRVPEVRERIIAYQGGARDDELSQIVIKARRPEETAIQTAWAWEAEQSPIVRVVQQRETAAVRVLMDSARQDIGSFPDIRVERVGGGSSNAGEIQRELERRFADMERVADQIRDEYRSSGPSSQLLIQLEQRHSDNAREIDQLSGVLRDAVDASTAGRGVTELRIQMADPDISLDTSEVTRAADELSDALEQAQRNWHTSLEKQVGSIYRMPSSAEEAEQLADAVRDFNRQISTRVSAEEMENAEVLRKLEDVQRLLESREGMALSDPRRSAGRPPEIRKVLNEMYDREPALNQR